MQTITTIGLDIAKSVFQVHGIGADGQVVVRRQLKRRFVLAFFQKLPPCLVGIEACASAHHWSRELQAVGHTVRLMPPAYVKPYVKRQKNDAADAEAICEAVTRANMRFVATKTPEQQSGLMLHRTRQLFIRQQTSVINAIRSHLAEFGIVAPIGRNGVEELLNVVMDAHDKRVPEVARVCLAALGAQLRRFKEQILEFDRLITAWHRSNEMSRRLDEILVSVQRWPPRWLPAWPIRRPSGQGATSQPGLAWCRSSTRVEAGTGSAISVNKVTVICAACS
jgi:transposase